MDRVRFRRRPCGNPSFSVRAGTLSLPGETLFPSAKARADRAAVRELRAEVREERAGSRELRAEVREERAGSWEFRAGVREERAGSRELRASVREEQAVVRAEPAVGGLLTEHADYIGDGVLFNRFEPVF